MNLFRFTFVKSYQAELRTHIPVSRFLNQADNISSCFTILRIPYDQRVRALWASYTHFGAAYWQLNYWYGPRMATLSTDKAHFGWLFFNKFSDKICFRGCRRAIRPRIINGIADLNRIQSTVCSFGDAFIRGFSLFGSVRVLRCSASASPSALSPE